MNADILRIMTICVALLGLATAAQGAAEYNYFTQHGYEDEINRCIDLLRPALGAQAGDKVVYDIQEIQLRGPWYQFEISTTIIDPKGNISVDDYMVGCKANRWIDSVQLAERRNTTQLKSSKNVFARD